MVSLLVAIERRAKERRLEMGTTRVAIVVVDGNPATTFPPNSGTDLGARAVSGACLAAGVDTRIFRLSDFRDMAMLVAAVVAYKPTMIALSAMTFAWSACVKLAKELEALCHTPIIFGGWHVSGIAKHVDEYPDLVQDFVGHPDWYGVVGEGYQTIVELIQVLESGDTSAKVNGIMHVVNGRVVLTPPRARMDPNLWPEIDRRDSPDPPGLSLLSEGSGCRFHCPNCATGSLVGRVLQRSPSRVVADMKQLVDTYGTHPIWLTNEDCGPDWLEAICREIQRAGLAKVVRWSSFGNASDFTRDPTEGTRLLQLLRRSGYTEPMVFGIESANPSILRGLRRSPSFEKTLSFVKMAKDAGISLWGTAMTGYPEETEAESEISLQQISDLDIQLLTLCLLAPYPGTELYRQAREGGLLLPGRTWEDFNGEVPLLKTPIDPDRLREMRLETIFRFYERRMSEHPEDYPGVEQSPWFQEVKRQLGVR